MTKKNININFKTAGDRINTATNFMITLIKKGRAVKWLVSLLAILMLATGCEKPCNENDPASDCYVQPPVNPPVNPIDAQLAAKRTEIHTFYRDSLGKGYKSIFEFYIPANPIMKDTTDIAPVATDDFLEASGGTIENPGTNTGRKAVKFADMCAQYVQLENQANK